MKDKSFTILIIRLPRQADGSFMEYENIPLGLALGLASNTAASAAYGEMSDFERQMVITEAETITNRVRMEDLVSRIGKSRGEYDRFS
ncbi:MAG: hypothetical protein FWE14_02595 [Lachnospiraceae bacterium]|nr:hypothetical protein [Lachnospiraceae bacterium]